MIFEHAGTVHETSSHEWIHRWWLTFHIEWYPLSLATGVGKNASRCSELEVATAAALCNNIHHCPSTVDELQGQEKGDVKKLRFERQGRMTYFAYFWEKIEVKSSPLRFQRLPGDF